ncbi:adenylyl-sulfate kinase [Variovorax sp. OV700]|uniref:adenylyl-sulfate kinase n=1 Tax=Variovorax sp. OV700 TaxID=1882826 RepID=UPI000B884F60|nr:adenylyl-sulfate kinase [Variovorax sp. OV700]
MRIDRDPISPQGQLSGGPCVIWLTGLSGAGKSTIAKSLRLRAMADGVPVAILDGDDVRRGLSQGLGFGQADRRENIRRIAEVARLLSEQGLVVIVAAVSPMRELRALARNIIGAAFREVYVSAPLATCERRDVKGLYARARRGEVTKFTGISDAYESPLQPDLVIDTSDCEVAQATSALMLAFRAWRMRDRRK